MSACLFCKILRKEIPARTVYEDDSVFAFKDSNPQAPVHILIIPRKHVPTTLDFGEEEKDLIGHMVLVANKLAREAGIAERGYRVVLNTNPESGQSVYHVHLHLLGGRRMHWPPG
jgi:histidine triad (HIT) family protein